MRVSLAIVTALTACSLAAATAHAKPIEPLTPEGLPNVQSDAAFIFDQDDGTVLFAKNPDKVRAIASTGKIFIAMVVRAKKMDLDAETEITEEDAKFAKGGARTRLPVGHKFKNGDLLRAMLIASDNRACTALGRAVGLTPDELVAEMNAMATKLGFTKTQFTDPSGINGNESTAREMSKALQHALQDEVLAEILSTRRTQVRSVASKPRLIDYFNTNKVLHRDANHVIGGKTGYTDDAGYCLVVAAEVGGRKVSMCFLGAQGKLTRFGDFGRVRDWVRANMSKADDTETADATTEAETTSGSGGTVEAAKTAQLQ